MPLHFLTDDATDAHPGDEVSLRDAEAHHAASVRRIRVGERVTVGDGAGVWLEAECSSVSPKEVVLAVTARRIVPAPHPRIVLAQALAKGDRDELAIQGATELGVDEIVPWQAERSVSRWDGKVDKALARWRTIVREASKQAHRPWLPDVVTPVGSSDLAARAASARMLILDPGARVPLAQLSAPSEQGTVVVVVGPEGGITPREHETFLAAGAEAVRLGDTVLRTSTAGTAALAVVNTLVGRW